MISAALLPGLITFSMGQTVLFAVAGPVFRDIGLSETQLGFIVSASALIVVISSPIWGKISDRFGRRPVILFGLYTYALTSFAFAGAMDLGLRGLVSVTAAFIALLMLRLLYAALGSGIQPASVALMADVSDEKDRSSAVAIIGAAFGFGMILGPASAALLVAWGVLVPLYVIAALAFLGALIATLFLKPEDSTDDESDRGPEVSIKLGPIIPLMICALAVFVAVSALQQTMAFYVQDYLGVDAEAAARATGICFVAMAVTTLLTQGLLLQILKLSPAALLTLGLPLMLVGTALYAFPLNFSQIILAAAILGVGFGLVNPGLMAAASLKAGDQSQGSVAGLIQAMMAGGYVIGPLTGTYLYEMSSLYTALFILIAFAFALASIVPFLPTLRITQPSGAD